MKKDICGWESIYVDFYEQHLICDFLCFKGDSLNSTSHGVGLEFKPVSLNAAYAKVYR